MNFFGFLWVISYLSSWFSPQNPLKVPDYLSKVFPVRAFSASTTPGDRSNLGKQSQINSAVSSSYTPRTNLLGLNLLTAWSRHGAALPLSSMSRSLSWHPLNWLSFTEALTQPVWRSDARQRSTIVASNHPFHVILPIAAAEDSRSDEDSSIEEVSSGFLGGFTRWSRSISQGIKASAAISVVRLGEEGTSATLPNTSNTPSLWECSGFQQPIRVSSHDLYQVRVRNQPIAEAMTRHEAELIAQRVKQLLQDPNFDPSELQPAFVKDQPAGMAGARLLFLIDQDLAWRLGRNSELIAVDWINNLRTALGGTPLPLADAQAAMYGLQPTGEQLGGIASWYGPYFHGRLTAAGETFNERELTAAHPSLPFDTYLKVTNLRSGKSIIVRINDRGPYVGERSLDLSREAARCLGSEYVGVVPYEAVIMQASPNQEPSSTSDDAPSQIADRRLLD